MSLPYPYFTRLLCQVDRLHRAHRVAHDEHRPLIHGIELADLGDHAIHGHAQAEERKPWRDEQPPPLVAQFCDLAVAVG